MALFGRKKSESVGQQEQSTTHLLVSRQAYCYVCRKQTSFTTCWQRSGMLRKCTCCAQAFENPAKLYAQRMPACPRCGELLEQPGFEYGECDECGSKFEFVEGCKPSLLPNMKQRAEMDKFGKSRSVD